MNRRLVRFFRALALLGLGSGAARAANPDAASPLVSYHFLDSPAQTSGQPNVSSSLGSYQFADSPGDSRVLPNLASGLVSYQHLEWPADQNLTFTTSVNVSYYYNGAPYIIAQPVAQVSKAGQPVSLTVVADGAPPLIYQWRLNGVPITSAVGDPGSGTLSAATGPTITLPNVQGADSGSYSCVVQNAHGTAFSNDARLLVFEPSSGTVQPLPSMTTAGSTPPILLDVPPAPGTLKVFTATGALDPKGTIYNNRKTIVMTHGWLSDPGDWPTKMRAALADQGYDKTTNILVWDWSPNAGTPKLWKAAGLTSMEGEALAKALLQPTALGPSYNQPIHFIGHSLGTLVNCRAVDYLHGDGINLPTKDAAAFPSSNTHVTLLDEAEVAVPQNARRVALDLLVNKSNLTNGEGPAAPAKVIPEHARFIDNYVSEVGLLHSRAANVLLWRRLAAPGIADIIFAHSYAHEWYKLSIAPPAASQLGPNGQRMGFYWSFERGTIAVQERPGAETFFLQSTFPSASPLAVTQLDPDTAALISRNRIQAYRALGEYQSVMYPSYEAYRGLNATGKAIEGVYLDGLQYAGNVGAEFLETFLPPTGQPVYSGTAGSTAMYFIEPGQSVPVNSQAEHTLHLRIQAGATQPQQLKIPMRAAAITDPATAQASSAFTVVPVQAPRESIGMTFEYKIEGAAPGDFFTMGIGAENHYLIEAKYVRPGEWNTVPVIQTSELAGQDVELVFALKGANGPPAGTLGIRNIQWFIPPRPRLELQVAGPQLTVFWPLSALDWTLESTTDVSDPNGWVPLGIPPVDGEYFHTQTFDISTTPAAFFRVRK